MHLITLSVGRMKRLLFTTLFSDDLGLFVCTLPFARGLCGEGHVLELLTNAIELT
jgi:hypothetical protein